MSRQSKKIKTFLVELVVDTSFNSDIAVKEWLSTNLGISVKSFTEIPRNALVTVVPQDESKVPRRTNFERNPGA